MAMQEERKSKQVFEMQVEGRFENGRPCITWEGRIGTLGQNYGRTTAEMKMIREERCDWQRWVEQDYPDA